jgi:hypothetical protein
MNIKELLDTIIDKTPKNLVFWAVIWFIMLGWYFFESIEFILVSSFTMWIIILFILLILSIFSELYLLYKIKDLDDEELKRLGIYIVILYFVGDILAYYAYMIILIWFVIFEIIVFILSSLEGFCRSKNLVWIPTIIISSIFLMIILLTADIGLLLMLSILIIQIIILLLTYNEYEKIRNKPLIARF